MKKIVRETGILGGKPIFEGTRIPVELILNYMAAGWKEHDLLEEYPTLNKTDLKTALRFAAKSVKREKWYPITL